MGGGSKCHRRTGGHLNAERFHRLFFALWPDDDLRAALAPQLAPLLAACCGRAQAPAQWHVTLEFLGSVPAARMAAASEAASMVRAGPLEIVFDTVEHWRRPEVLCLVAREVPVPLVSLVSQLRSTLAARGFPTEHRVFRAHFTLARKVVKAAAVPAFGPIRWPARDFALVESVTDRAGSRYHPLARWQLVE
jgi:2'-5' RNA ligase